MTKLEELLSRKRTKRNFCVIRFNPNDTYYVGSYGMFTDRQAPKVYNQLAHAKNALGQLAQAKFDADAYEAVRRQGHAEQWTREQWNAATFTKWHHLSEAKREAYKRENFAIIELEIVDGKFKEKPKPSE